MRTNVSFWAGLTFFIGLVMVIGAHGGNQLYGLVLLVFGGYLWYASSSDPVCSCDCKHCAQCVEDQL